MISAVRFAVNIARIRSHDALLEIECEKLDLLVEQIVRLIRIADTADQVDLRQVSEEVTMIKRGVMARRVALSKTEYLAQSVIEREMQSIAMIDRELAELDIRV